MNETFSGACELKAVAIVGKLEAGEDYAYKEWQRTVKSVVKWLKAHDAKASNDEIEALARTKVKYTLPGPMTIMDCIVDQFYGEEKREDLRNDLIKVINKVHYPNRHGTTMYRGRMTPKYESQYFLQEILSLANHGCKVIQVDEPVLMRYPDQAIAYGVDDVIRCFQGST